MLPFEESDFANLSMGALFILVQPLGIEPSSMVLQTTAMTTSAKVALGCLMGFEPTHIGITTRGLNRLTTSTVKLFDSGKNSIKNLTSRFKMFFHYMISHAISTSAHVTIICW